MMLTIGFAKPKPFFVPIAWAIQLVEGTKYNHMYFRYQTEMGDQAFQSNISKGAHYTTIAELEGYYNTLEAYGTSLTEEQSSKMLQLFDRFNGSPYGFGQLFGALAARIFGLSKNPFSRGPKTVTCSELGYFLLDDLFGYKLKSDPDIIGVKEIHDALGSIGFKRLS